MDKPFQMQKDPKNPSKNPAPHLPPQTNQLPLRQPHPPPLILPLNIIHFPNDQTHLPTITDIDVCVLVGIG